MLCRALLPGSYCIPSQIISDPLEQPLLLCALLSVIKHPLSRSIGVNVPLEHAVYSLDLPLRRWKYDEDIKIEKINMIRQYLVYFIAIQIKPRGGRPLNFGDYLQYFFVSMMRYGCVPVYFRYTDFPGCEKIKPLCGVTLKSSYNELLCSFN
jgi:hypothetical protein